jgi:hypothetical protein
VTVTAVGIAEAAVGILAPYFAMAGGQIAKRVGDATVDAMKELYQAIRRKFDADPDPRVRETLRTFEETPEDEERQNELAGALAGKVDTDSLFAEELARLVGSVTQGSTVGQFVTQVYGGKVDQIVNIAKVDRIDMH